MTLIAASILDADYADLEHEIVRVAEAGIDAFTLDVMDNHFAPRITFGEFLVARIRSWVTVPIETHLMIERPERFVQRYCDAGADMVLFHVEAAEDPLEAVRIVRGEGRGVGVAIKCETPLTAISDELLTAVDLVNLLAVPVGFGGGETATDTLDRVAALRERCAALGTSVAVEIDGGVKPANARHFGLGGADVLTVGTGIYHAPDPAEAVRRLKESTADIDARLGTLATFLSVPSLSVPSRTAARDVGGRARLTAIREALDIPRRVWDPAATARATPG